MIAGLIGGAFGLLFALFGGVITLGLFVLWVWMLVHAITNKALSDGEKIAWVLAVIFVPVVGPILYFFIGRPKASSKTIRVLRLGRSRFGARLQARPHSTNKIHKQTYKTLDYAFAWEDDLSPCPRSARSQALAKEVRMPRFLHQVSYTSDAMSL